MALAEVREISSPATIVWLALPCCPSTGGAIRGPYRSSFESTAGFEFRTHAIMLPAPQRLRRFSHGEMRRDKPADNLAGNLAGMIASSDKMTSDADSARGRAGGATMNRGTRRCQRVSLLRVAAQPFSRTAKPNGVRHGSGGAYGERSRWAEATRLVRRVP